MSRTIYLKDDKTLKNFLIPFRAFRPVTKIAKATATVMLM